MSTSVEVGSGHFAVIPSFKGFRKAVNAEAAAAGTSGAHGFQKAMGRGGDVAGGLAGRGFARGFSKSASVSQAMQSVEKEIRAASAAIAKTRLGEQDAAGRVRVAEAQLAEARSKYAAGSSQVVRAEERVASARRAHTAVAERLRAEQGRLAQAQRVLASAQAGVGRTGGVWAQLRRDVEPLRAHVQAASTQLGSFVRTAPALAGVRSAVSGLSMAWARVSGVVSGLGPVVLRPLGQQFAGLAKQAGSWARSTALSIPGVGRAVSALQGPLARAGGFFSSLGKVGANVAGTLGRAFGPVGSSIAAGLGRGFTAAVAAAGSAAGSIASTFQTVIGGAVTASVVALGGALRGGFDRLASVETATAKMRGFGMEAGAVTAAMDQVKSAVAGTVYTVGDMGNAAAAALVAGVKPGEQLARYMDVLKNTATGTGRPLNEIQSIMGKVVAGQAAYTTELMQLQDSGIPIFTLLAEKMGVSVAEIKNMASEGKISSDVLVETLGGAMGKMAEEVGGTTVSALTRMRSSFARFGEALMKESFPAVKAVADAVRAVMDAAIALMGPIKAAFGLDEVGPGIARIEAFTERVNAFTEMIKSGGEKASATIQKIVDGVREFGPLLGLAAAAAVPLMGSFLSGLPVIGGLFAGLGPGLLGGLAPLLAGGGLIAMLAVDPAKMGDMLAGLVDSVVSGLGSLTESIGSLIQRVVPAIVSNLAGNAPVIAEAFGSLFSSLGSTVSTLIPMVVGALATLLPALITSLVSMLPGLISGAIDLFMGIVQGVVAAIPAIVSALTGLLPQLVVTLVGAIPQLLQGAVSLFMALVTGLVQALPSILTAVIGMIPQLIGALLSMLPDMITGALNLFLGLVLGLVEALPQIITAIVGAIPQLVSALVSMIPQLITGAVQLFLGIVTGLVQAIPQIISALIGMIPQLVGALIGAVPQLLQAGVDLIKGLVEGIAQSGQMVFDAIGKVVTGAIDWAKGLLGIKSPSRVFMGIGGYLGEGLSLGIESTRGKVAEAAGSLAEAARAEFRALEGETFAGPSLGLQLERAGASVSGVRGVAARAARGLGAPASVVQQNEIHMQERDPRLVLRQLGRELEVSLGGSLG